MTVLKSIMDSHDNGLLVVCLGVTAFDALSIVSLFMFYK